MRENVISSLRLTLRMAFHRKAGVSFGASKSEGTGGPH